MTYSPFRHLSSVIYKGNPIQLTFFVTGQCNARCPFCFYLSQKKKIETSQAELSIDEIKRVSASIGKLLWLAFSGGEIFLRDDLGHIAEIFYQQNKPSIMLFPTNGMLTTKISNTIEKILQNCPKSTVVVKLSLDGPETVHDSIRGVTGSYQKTLNTYYALGELVDKYSNFELGINSVFCADNQDTIEDLLAFVAGLDRINTHTVSLIRGDVSDVNQKNVNLKKYRQVIDTMEMNLKKKIASTYRFKGARLKAAQDILQRRLIYKTAKDNKYQMPCYAGKLNLVLTETGDLYPCESFKMKLGNVREEGYDVMNIVKNGKAAEIIKSVKKTRCYCTHECYVMTNILFNPAQYPALLKLYSQL